MIRMATIGSLIVAQRGPRFWVAIWDGQRLCMEDEAGIERELAHKRAYNARRRAR